MRHQVHHLGRNIFRQQSRLGINCLESIFTEKDLGIQQIEGGDPSPLLSIYVSLCDCLYKTGMDILESA